MKRYLAVATLLASFEGTCTYGAVFRNGGFENGWDGWSFSGPVELNLASEFGSGIMSGAPVGGGPPYVAGGVVGFDVGEGIGSISQHFDTAPGQSYLVRFYFGNGGSSADQRLTIRVTDGLGGGSPHDLIEAGTGTVAVARGRGSHGEILRNEATLEIGDLIGIFGLNPTGLDGEPFSEFTFRFTAESNESVIEFADPRFQDEISSVGSLDEVSIVPIAAVPEVGSCWWACVTVALCVRRKRRGRAE